MRGHPSRRDFLRMAAAAGFLGPAPSFAPGGQDAAEEIVGKEYLARGLAALSGAHRFPWNHAHHAAAVVAGYYFCRENTLDRRTRLAVKKQLDDFIAYRRAYLGSEPERGGKPAPPDPIVEILSQNLSRLRSGGHDAIYGGLALKALRDLPEMATAGTVDGVVRLIRRVLQELPAIEPTEVERDNPAAPYRGDQDVVDVTCEAILRPREGFAKAGLRGAGNAIHWVTHADALLTLSELGYADAAKAGHRAHRQYVPRAADEPGEAAPEAPAERFSDWLGAEFWEGREPRASQGGSWLFSHAFKFPYSLFRLLRKVGDPAKKARCVERGAWLAARFKD